MEGLRSNGMGLLMGIMIIGAFVQIQRSEAQTTHTVGDAIGWNVPPAGQIAYTTWAALQNFTVGDVLLFNFTTNAHNVAEVTQSAFDSCNTISPISLTTTGPANITLQSAGSHYFICTVGPHCNLGQKLAINVTSASSTPPAAAPQPSAATPPPVSTPTPAASPATPPPVSTPTPAASPATPPSASTPPTSAPTPSTVATPPTTTMTPPTTEGGVTSPPPPSSAPRAFAAAALPITFLSVAIAFLY